MHTKHLLGHHATVHQHCWGQGVAAVSRRPALHARREYSVLKVDEPRTLQQRLVGRFGGGEIAQGRACAVWLKVGAPELSSGPVGEIQEVSRVGAQGVTSKSKLLAREMPRVCSGGLRNLP